MTDEELARRLTEALDARIERAVSAPVSRETLNRLPTPDSVGGSNLEAIPVRRARWKTALAAVLAVCMLGGVGLLAHKLAGRNGPMTSHTSTTEEPQTTEPEVEAPLPEVSFDEETKTLHVVGTGGYHRLDLTSYLSDARYLEVEDDDFRFSANVATMNSMFASLQQYGVGITDYLDRLDGSTSYIRQSIKDNVSDGKVAAELSKPIIYSMKSWSGSTYTNTAEQIELELGRDTVEYDAQFTLALMNRYVNSWRHLGFAYWMGCVDPYCFMSGYEGTPVPSDSDYYYMPDYFRAGGTGKTWETKERLLYMDACSWYNLNHGMDWAGANPERRPIWKDPSASGNPGEEGNDMSLFMAISLINYLSEQYGTEKVAAYCFDVCSFEEAFGMDFAAARAAWEQSLADRFGDSGEAQETPVPEVSFDEETQTLRIVGTEGYDRLDLSRLEDAKTLELEDDKFRLTLNVSVLSSVTLLDHDEFLRAYLNRLDRSTDFIGQFIAENAPNETVAAQTEKPVIMTLESLYHRAYSNEPDQIELTLGNSLFQHGYLYTLGLMDPQHASWQHLGFASWVQSCVDPYDSMNADMDEADLSWDTFYSEDYYRAGGTGKLSEPEEMILYYDAIAWYHINHGTKTGTRMIEWATVYQSDFYHGDINTEGNNMTIAMAVSMINYLSEQYGTEKVAAYVFDTCSFEEAFGMDFAAARAAWEQSLMERFGSGETETQTSP